MAMQPGAKTMWHLPPNEYRIEEWSLDGELVRTLTRNVEWFKESWHHQHSWDVPIMMRIAIDRNGNLWVMATVPISGKMPRVGYLDTWNDTWDMVVEVIDPHAEKVIAKGYYEEATLRPMPGSDYLFAARQTEEGYIMFDVLRPRLR